MPRKTNNQVFRVETQIDAVISSLNLKMSKSDIEKALSGIQITPEINVSAIQKTAGKISDLLSRSFGDINTSKFTARLTNAFKNSKTTGELQKSWEAIYQQLLSISKLKPGDRVLAAGLSETDLNKVIKNLDLVQKKIKDINSQVESRKSELLSGELPKYSGLIKTSANKKKIFDYLDDALDFTDPFFESLVGNTSTESFDKLSENYNNVIALIKGYQKEIEDIRSKDSSVLTTADYENLIQYNQALQTLVAQINKYEAQFKSSYGAADENLVSKQLGLGSLADYENAANRAATAFGNAYKKELESQLNEIQAKTKKILAKGGAYIDKHGGQSDIDTLIPIASGTPGELNGVGQGSSAGIPVEPIGHGAEFVGKVQEAVTSSGQKVKISVDIDENISEVSNKIDSLFKTEDKTGIPLQVKIDDSSVLQLQQQLNSVSLDGLKADLDALYNKALELQSQLRNLDIAPSVEITSLGRLKESIESLDVCLASAGDIYSNLDRIVESFAKLRDIGDINLPAFEKIETSRLEKLISLLDDLEKVNFILKSLNDTLEVLGNKGGFKELFDSLKISKATVNNLSGLNEALVKLNETLKKYSKVSKNTLKNIADIAAQPALFKNLDKIVKNDNISEKIVSVKKTTDSEGSADTKEAAEAAAQYKKLTKSLSQYYAVKKKIDSGGNVTDKQRAFYNEISVAIQKAIEDEGKFSQSTDEAKNAVAAFQAEIKKLNISSFDNNIVSLQKQFEALSSPDVTLNKTSEYSVELQRISGLIESLKRMGPVDLLKEDELQDWKELRNNISEAMAKLQDRSYSLADPKKVANSLAEFEKFIARNSRGAKSSLFTDRVTDTRSAYNSVISDADFDRATEMFAKLRADMEATGKVGKSLGDELSGKLRSAAIYFTTFVNFYDIINQLQRGLGTIVEYNTALTNLNKVADVTNEQLREFGENSYTVADGIGATNLAVIDAAAEWARLGYSIKEADKLARTSTIYANVGELDAGTATKDMVSIMKAFNIDAQRALEVVDVLNELGNRYATSSAELGEVLTRSASALYVAGEDLDSSAALATGMQEIVQNAPVVGTTLKTLSMRLRGAETDLEAAGEDTDGMAKSVSELRDQILTLTDVSGTGGFDIMRSPTEFKSTYEILQGIAEVWDYISDVDQANLLELIAGKRAGSNVAAILNNFDTVERAYITAQNSLGSAEKENEHYLNSLQGQINILENKWNKLWTTPTNEELYTFVVKLGQAVLDVADNIGILGVALTGAGLFGAFKDFGQPVLKVA